MDYEKKYKNALTIAQSRFKIEKDESVLTCLGMMFPELRESEDERIRKWLVDYFGSIKETVWIHRDITCEQILDWLEKQKEQKPNIEICPHSIKSKSYLETGYPIEPKPAEKQDYSGLTDLERAIHRGFLVAGVENVSVTIIKETAQDCLAHMHAEWSEEDKRRIDAICELLENTSAIHPNYSHRKLIIWLKSLRPQPKQEWSEEDENKIESIKGLITTGRFADTNTIRTIWKLLDSIRPQHSWKPSEEQMEAFRKYIEDFQARAEAAVGGWNNFDVMIRLYEQLKKL